MQIVTLKNKYFRLEDYNPNFFLQSLHIFVLFSFAVAQPVFDILSQYPEFLIAHHTVPTDIFILVFLFVFIAPLMVVLIEAAIRLINQRLYSLLHGIIVACLFIVIALPVLKKTDSFSGIIILLSATAIGIVALLIYLRFQLIKKFIVALSPAILIFPILFLFHPQINKLIFPQNVTLFNLKKTGYYPPIIMVVFDEFPVASLMDEHMLIDAVRYPNFSKLSESSYWFRNATTINQGTPVAVPAILTGSYPDINMFLSAIGITKESASLEKLSKYFPKLEEAGLLHPTSANYPNNIFSLLSSAYMINATENASMICPEKINLKKRNPFVKRILPLSTDIGFVYLHIIVPDSFLKNFPDVRQAWKGFGNESIRKRSWTQNRKDQFEAFIESIRISEKPVFYFIHTLLPHVPWVYYPSGKTYDNFSNFFALPCKTSESLIISQAYQRHLLQVGMCDMLLGKLIKRLTELNMYDRSLIIITADHGCSFMSNEPRRGVSEKNFSDILCVPLFIKIPGQSQSVISDKNVETIDILSTVADLLQINLPWPVDGYSMINETIPERTQKLFYGLQTFYNKNFEPMVFEKNIIPKITPTLEQKTSLFSTGTTRPNGLFNLGLQDYNLIGNTIEKFHILDDTAFSIELNNATRYKNLNINDLFIPGLISGRVITGETHTERPLYLAVSVNGVIQGVTQVYTSKKLKNQFSCLVSDKSFKNGKNDVDVYVLSIKDESKIVLKHPKII